LLCLRVKTITPALITSDNPGGGCIGSFAKSHQARYTISNKWT
jgi:hypothetical protein